MRRLLFGIFSLALLSSCDDGEIIVTNFDFEESTFKFCDGPDKNVIYAVNNNDVFESISLEFNNSQLKVDENGNLIPPEEEQVFFALSGNNRIVYRIFDEEVPSDYFCNVVPPSSPKVIEEWISGTGATVFINTSFTDETPDSDPDNDGLDNRDEGWTLGGPYQDTDDDGIPDYLDRDDDGDNVITEVELLIGEDDPVNNDGYRDTDEDGIPNYLDNDDDDDTVLTRLEVDEGDKDNPEGFATAEGIPNYLNPAQTAEIQHDEYIPHDISRNYRFQIVVDNLKFDRQGSGESIQYETYNFGTLRASSVDFPQCPSQDPDCSVTDSEEPAEETGSSTN